jgi:predicted RNA polymerase sigma factor
VAVGMALGPEAGLRLVEPLLTERTLEGYPQLAAVRGDLLAKLGRHDEARAEFARAAELTRNEAERVVFLRRADQP